MLFVYLFVLRMLVCVSFFFLLVSGIGCDFLIVALSGFFLYIFNYIGDFKEKMSA